MQSLRVSLAALIIAATTAAAQQGIVPAGAGVDGNPVPHVVRYVQPEYPPAAAAARITGLVGLDVVVNEAGRAESVRVVRGTSSLFDDAAAEAVRQWIFTAPFIDGRPARLALTVSVNFTMGRLAPRLVTPITATSDVSSPLVDFAFEYQFGCPAGGTTFLSTTMNPAQRGGLLGTWRSPGATALSGGTVEFVPFQFTATQLETLYRHLVPTGLVARTATRLQTAEQPFSVERRDNGMAVTVVGEVPPFAVYNSVSTGVISHSLEVWLDTSWHRLTWSEPRERAGQAGSEELERVGALLRQMSREMPEVRSLAPGSIPCL